MRRKSNNLGLAIFLIVLAIFYYEITYKAEIVKEEVISNIEGEKVSESIKYDEEKSFNIEDIDSITIKAVRSKIIFKRDSSLSETKIKIKGNNLKELKILKTDKKNTKNIVLTTNNGAISNAKLVIKSPIILNLNISNMNGEETISGGGDIYIKEIYSNILIEDSKSVKIDTAYGKIDVRNIKGDTEIDTRYSKIHVENIQKDLKINTKFGESIYAKEVKGSVSIMTKYTPVYLTDIKGDIYLKNRYSDKIFIKSFSVAKVETSYSRIFPSNGETLILIGKENGLKCEKIKNCKIAGKNNKVSGSVENIDSTGKYNTLSFKTKGGFIKEESGDINLEIDKLKNNLSIDLIDTPVFIRINDKSGVFFVVEAIDSTLTSNFLKLTNEDGNVLKAIFGNSNNSIKFSIKAKYSKITVND